MTSQEILANLSLTTETLNFLKELNLLRNNEKSTPVSTAEEKNPNEVTVMEKHKGLCKEKNVISVYKYFILHHHMCI